MLTKNIITNVYFLDRMVHLAPTELSQWLAFDSLKESSFFVLTKRGEPHWDARGHAMATVDVAPKFFSYDEISNMTIPTEVENIWWVDKASPAFKWLTSHLINLELPENTRIPVGAC